MNRTNFCFANNNQGSVIIVALLMLVALSLTVIMAMDTSMMNSSMMRNNRDYRDNLYRSESGITIAAEVHRTEWLHSASELFDLTDGNAFIADDAELDDAGGNSVRVASYEIARIEDWNEAAVNGYLNADALTREFFPLPHITAPPVGAGISSKNFEVRRYGIFSNAVNRQNNVATLRVEAGLFKTFTKVL